ncbi:hypothetical protein EPUL_006758, partial [Erysiphe pulchra]
MEYFMEKQAFSTEMSSSIPPIPPIPPNTLYLPNPTTPPSPPQNNKTPGDQVLNRKILEPVIPSKRVASNAADSKAADSTTTSHSNEAENTHPYIPRELLEIFTARKRQEQAWHTRFLVCTCFLSCFDGTVSNFQEGAKKGMAKTIQLYLRSAISEFAAADTAPEVPKFFPAETIHKLSSTSKANLPRKPPIVATLKMPTEKINYMSIQASNPLPNITKNTENCWAAIARNGHKKSRTTKNSVLQTTQAKKQNSQASAGSAKK